MATAKLTTLTPVHVGSGEKLLRNFDFIVQNGKVGFLDLKKVMDKIGYDRLPQLTAAIEKKEVKAFLKSALPNASLEEVCSRVVKTSGHITQNTSELKTQFRTALEGTCIPGSSLKGSMRTAMVSYLTDSDRKSPAQQSELLRDVNWTDSKRVNFNRLDSKLFGDTANAKSTRFLTVGDIQFSDKDAEVQELSYINQLGNGEWEYENRKLQLVECVRKGATASFQLKLSLDLAAKYNQKRKELVSLNAEDRTMAALKDLSFFNSDEEGFLQNLNNYTRKLLSWDVQKLKDLNAEPDLIAALNDVLAIVEACQKGEAVLRVGGHNGWHFMTGRWMMYDANVFTDDMFDTMQAAAQRNTRYVGLQFPKTRKMTDAGLPMGFVKIELF